MRLLGVFLVCITVFSRVWAVNFGHFPAAESFGEQGMWYEGVLQLPLAQTIACGRGVYVVQIDSGVYEEHPALKGHILLSLAYSFGDNSTDVSDRFGHGTATAGIIAEVAPCAGIIPLKINRGGEGWFSAEAVRKALKYALELSERYPVRVVNMSIVLAERDPEIERLIEKLSEKGILVVAAAGNDSKGSVSFPASAPGAVAVSALGSDIELTPSSNHGKRVFLSAPGAWIRVPSIFGGYTYMSGTSMAAAFVSGIAALVAEMKPDGLKLWLARGSADKGEPGYDEFYGFGAASALYAVVAALSERVPVIPDVVEVEPGEERSVYFWSEGKVTAVSMDPNVASVRVKSRWELEVEGKSEGETDVFLVSDRPFAVARVRVRVSDEPRPVLSCIVYPCRVADSADFCFLADIPERFSGGIYFSETKESDEGFTKRVLWNVSATAAPGRYADCWRWKPGASELTEVLLCGDGFECSRSIVEGKIHP